jgi:hypothetical protein
LATLLHNANVRDLIESDYLAAISEMDDATTRLTLALGLAVGAASCRQPHTTEMRDELREASDGLRHAATRVAELAAVVNTSATLPPAPGQVERVRDSLVRG